MRRICGIAVIVFAVMYLLALAALAVGTFGLFGAETDPLAGVFLMPLGLPWNRFIDAFPRPLWPWLAALAPLLNLLLLGLLCRLSVRSKEV
jgi:hypothetical protein